MSPKIFKFWFIFVFIISFSGNAWAQAQPSVTSTNPASGATNVMRDVFVSADVFVPNGGIDPATLTSSSVFLQRTSDLQNVPAVLNTSGGGDVIVLRPVSGADTFSVRWTGQVQARFSQTYTFYTTSDDGVRLWVNGVQLINNWTNHSATENSGTIALLANQKYDILLEHYENTGSAVAKL